MMTLKVELEMNDSSERQTEDVALNAKLKMWHDDFEWWIKTMALNAKLNMQLWTPKLKSDGGSERWNWEMMVALKAKI